MDKNQSKILVTGATGLLGSHLIKKLVESGLFVKAMYRSVIPESVNTQRIEWIKGDILNISTIEEALEDVELVYHCAAMVSFSPKRKKELFKTNVEGTANVVNACISKRIKKLLHVSSVAAINRSRNETIINENIRWKQDKSTSTYGLSKYLAEKEVWRGIGEGLEGAIINPSIILGAGDWNKGSSEIFKTAYKEFPWFTDGVTGFVDVNDVVTAMLLLMNSDLNAERFIINSENISFKNLFSMIAECFNKKPPHKQVTPLIASLVWQFEAFRSVFTGKSPLLTKETAASAQAKVYFDNSKLLTYFPQFQYTPLKKTVNRICSELKEMNNLS